VSESGGLALRLVGVQRFFVEPRILAQFSAPDPWHGGAVTDWLLVLSLMSESLSGPNAAAHVVRGYKRDDLPGPGRRDFAFAETLALVRAVAPDTPLFLPHALSAVWQQGGCPTDALPRILYTLKPRLIRSDFYFADAMRGSLRFRLGVATVAAMALLLLGLHLITEPQGFQGTHNLFLHVSLIPVLGAVAMVLFQHWLIRRRAQLEALCRSLVLSTIRPLPVRRAG
jgi:hypothetical protein